MTDIELKTSAGAMNNVSFNNLVTTVDKTVTGLNQTSLFLATLIPDIVKGLATAGAFTLEIPFGFNLPCINANLLSSLIPPGLASLIGSIDQINNLVQDIVGIPVTLMNIKSQIEGNIDALKALGLPLSFSFAFDPSIMACVDLVDQLTDVVKIADIAPMKIDKFDAVVDRIFINNSIRVNPLK